MGERIEPREIGERCDNHHEPDETPPFIYVYFWGIDACPDADPPPNFELFKLYQVDGHPCIFKHDTEDSVWLIQLQMMGQPVGTKLSIFHDNQDNYFNIRDQVHLFEHDILDNANDECMEGIGGIGGKAIAFWLDAVDEIIDGFVIPRYPKLFLEFFMIDDTALVYKLCNTRYHLNQTFKVDL